MASTKCYICNISYCYIRNILVKQKFLIFFTLGVKRHLERKNMEYFCFYGLVFYAGNFREGMFCPFLIIPAGGIFYASFITSKPSKTAICSKVASGRRRT